MSKRCPEKNRMPDEDAAVKALRHMVRKGKGQWRVYRCQLCDGWHATSAPVRGPWYDARVHERVYGQLTRLTFPGHDPAPSVTWEAGLRRKATGGTERCAQIPARRC